MGTRSPKVQLKKVGTDSKLPSREGRNAIAVRDLFFGLLAQLQVFEVHVIRMPTCRAHQPVQHLLGITEWAMRCFQINDDFASTVRTIGAQHALAHALILPPKFNPVSAARHYTGVPADLPTVIGGLSRRVAEWRSKPSPLT